MRRTLSLTALALSLATVGCNGSPGLTVSGSVDIDASGTPTGFTFSQPVRLDGAAPAGAITGTCTLSRAAGDPDYGIIVDLYGPDTTEGRGLRSITLMTRTDATASGTVEAELGADTFRGTCDVTTPRVDDAGLLRIQVSGCSIANGAETATVEADLSFEGCTLLLQ